MAYVLGRRCDVERFFDCECSERIDVVGLGCDRGCQRLEALDELPEERRVLLCEVLTVTQRLTESEYMSARGEQHERQTRMSSSQERSPHLVSRIGKSGELGQLAVKLTDTPRAFAHGSSDVSSSAVAADATAAAFRRAVHIVVVVACCLKRFVCLAMCVHASSVTVEFIV